MAIATAIRFANSGIALSSAPINPDWILGGAPVARAQQIYRSKDGAADTFIWECTAGRFNWFYVIDETVYVIEGSVVVRDEEGIYNHLQAGSTIFFPAGSKAEWLVDKYVRKIAFCRVPLTRKLIAARFMYRRIRRLFGRASGAQEAAHMLRGRDSAHSS
jgi:uncharacterized cupin superfamily protein